VKEDGLAVINIENISENISSIGPKTKSRIWAEFKRFSLLSRLAASEQKNLAHSSVSLSSLALCALLAQFGCSLPLRGDGAMQLALEVAFVGVSGVGFIVFVGDNTTLSRDSCLGGVLLFDGCWREGDSVCERDK
jgi:hypothetical protein